MKKLISFIVFVVLVGLSVYGLKIYSDNNAQEPLTSVESTEIKEDINANYNKRFEKKPILISAKNGVISIRSKYNDDYDINYLWSQNGGNSLFDYHSSQLIPNKDEYPTTTGEIETSHNAATDFLGPHMVMAINNIDGDYLDGTTHFTGGNHAYENKAEGSPTARTIDIAVKVDGEEIDDYMNFNKKADNIEISWVNYVQASNTKKIDGSGREVLKETYNLVFDGEKYTITNKIEFLEDVFWERLYGIQFSYRDNWNDTITYVYDDSEETYPISENTDASYPIVKEVIISDGTNNVAFGIDTNSEVGSREFLNDVSSGAFNNGTGKKAYLRLVNNQYMNAGDIVEYSGHYRFYSE